MTTDFLARAGLVQIGEATWAQYEYQDLDKRLGGLTWRDPVSGHEVRTRTQWGLQWNMNNLGSTERVDTLLENTPGLRLTYKGLIA